MRCITWNVNGLRSVAQKGFLDFVHDARPDFLCLQEIKCFSGQVPPEIETIPGYRSYFYSAKKPGYSGVAIYSKLEPLRVREGMGHEPSDLEGRVLTAEFQDFTLVTAYFPNSQRDHARLSYKLEFCAHLEEYLRQWPKVLLCGDFNIAHRAIDLKNPKANEQNAGYLPEERACFDRLLSNGFHDVLREDAPDQEGLYTWWSYRPGIRERNIGWRLDMHVASAQLRPLVGKSRIYAETRGSDHAPVEVELKIG